MFRSLEEAKQTFCWADTLRKGANSNEYSKLRRPPRHWLERCELRASPSRGGSPVLRVPHIVRNWPWTCLTSQRDRPGRSLDGPKTYNATVSSKVRRTVSLGDPPYLAPLQQDLPAEGSQYSLLSPASFRRLATCRRSRKNGPSGKPSPPEARISHHERHGDPLARLAAENGGRDAIAHVLACSDAPRGQGREHAREMPRRAGCDLVVARDSFP